MAGKKQSLTPEEKLARALVPQDQQPYKLPKGWVWTKIKEITTRIKRGRTPKYVEKSDVLVFAQKCNQKDGTINLDKAQYLNPDNISKYTPDEYLLDLDTIINSTGTGTLGRVGLYKEADNKTQLKIVPDTHITIVRAKTNLNPYYMNLYLVSLKEYLEQQGSGSTNQKELKPDTIGNLLFPLPPLPEQQRIVSRIESLFTKLDAARDKLQQVLDTQEARRAAILHKAFTGRLTGHKGSEEGSSQNILLKDCGTWHGGGTPSKSHEEYWENGDIMWITSKDMKSNLIDSSMVSINKKGVENSSAIYCEKPSVLFVMRSGILRHSFPVAVVKQPYTVNQDLKALVPNPDLLPEYIFWACKSNEQDILHQCMKSGTTVESINFQALQQFKIPYYPLNLQEYIVKRINDLMKREDSVSEITQSTLSQIDLLKKSILARAFRGQLGTQDPSDPDARDLLTSD